MRKRIDVEMARYPETGIVNPFTNTKFCLTEEMQDFFNQYLLVYRDYPDAKIAEEYANRFGIIKEAAKGIEYAYVVVNRARIYKRIESLLKQGYEINVVSEQITRDFGIDMANAERYVRRCGMDMDIGGLLVGSESEK